MGHEFEALSGRIIEVAVHVHRVLGPGYLESIYEGAMRVALSKAGLTFEFQKNVPIVYEGIEVGSHRCDLIIENEIVVELKAIIALEDIHFLRSDRILRPPDYALDC